MTESHFKNLYRQYKQKVNKKLDCLIPEETAYPGLIHEAMRYSLFAGGKRLRPVLCLAAYNVLKDDYEKALSVACSLECVHTYSLIHDDLPCMDDDDFRRGMPTCHKKFGEAIAVLAGDSLLTVAFKAACDFHDSSKIKQIIEELADTSGSQGLVGGQVMDILSENKKIESSELEYIHEHKTGKLILSSVRLGAICAGADEKSLNSLSEYAKLLGLAFQISDDLLDVIGNSEAMGKTVGQDEKLNKATYPSLYGIEETKKILTRTIDQACASLDAFEEKACFLKDLARFVAERNN